MFGKRSPGPKARLDGSGARTIALLVLLGVLWGITFPMVRRGVAAGASPFLLVALDFGLAAAAAFAIAAATGDRAVDPPSGRYLAGSMLLGGLLIGVNNLLMFWGLQFTTGGVAAVVYATVPLLAVLAGLFLGYRERLGAATFLALSLGLVGVLILELTASGSGVITNDWAIPSIVGGASAQATGTVLIVRYRPRGESRFGLAAQFGGASIAGACALLLFPGTVYLSPTLAVIGGVFYVALFSGVAGYTVFFELTRRSGAVGTSLVMYLTPIVGLLFGALVLSEAVGSTEIAGLGLILGALFLYEVSWRGRGRRDAGRPESSSRAPGPPPAPDQANQRPG